MKKKKVHFFSADPERGMPIDISREHYQKGLRGTKCGYMRTVTFDKNKVTCFYCLRIISENQL